MIMWRLCALMAVILIIFVLEDHFGGFDGMA